jgi:hypothetical protein
VVVNNGNKSMQFLSLFTILLQLIENDPIINIFQIDKDEGVSSVTSMHQGIYK